MKEDAADEVVRLKAKVARLETALRAVEVQFGGPLVRLRSNVPDFLILEKVRAALTDNR
jgi:hypothetical protein